MAQTTLISKLPTEAESLMARETSQLLKSHLQNSDPLRIRLLDDPGNGTIEVPQPAVQMLVHLLEEMARGNAVTLMPVHAELTTQEAADMLSISRLSLIKLLEEGKIEYRKAGMYRRIRVKSLMAYKRLADANRRAALAELAAYDQELGI